MEQRERISLGEVLKSIRSRKGISAKTFAVSMGISSSQLTKIESDQQTLSAELLIKALSYLNVSFEEFVLLIDTTDSFKARVETKRDLARVSTRRNNQYLQLMINRAEKNYEIYKEPYFQHIYCMLSGLSIFNETNDYKAARVALEPVSNYFSTVESWYEYELGLFCNCHYLFPLEEAMKLGNEALAKIKDPSTSTNYNEFAHNLFLCLALYALEDPDYCIDAIDFASKALSSQVTKPLYTSMMVEIIHQIAYYKLQSHEYDSTYFSKLTTGLKLLNFDQFYDRIIVLFKKHGIPLEDFE